MLTDDERLIVAEADKILDEKMMMLSRLYETTGQDWDIVMHHTLTEPVCPTAIIKPSWKHPARYRHDEDGVLAVMLAAIDHAHRELVLGETVGHAAPYTNPDDGDDQRSPEEAPEGVETDVLRRLYEEGPLPAPALPKDGLRSLERLDHAAVLDGMVYLTDGGMWAAHRYGFDRVKSKAVDEAAATEAKRT